MMKENLNSLIGSYFNLMKLNTKIIDNEDFIVVNLPFLNKNIQILITERKGKIRIYTSPERFFNIDDDEIDILLKNNKEIKLNHKIGYFYVECDKSNFVNKLNTLLEFSYG